MSEWSRCLPYAHLIDLLVQPSPGLLIYSQITPMGICNRNYITPNKCTVMNKCLAVSAGYLNCRIAARFRQISSTILYDALPYTDPFRWQPYIFGRKYDNKAPANGLAPLSTRASADAVITKFVFRRYTAVSLEVVNNMDVIKKRLKYLLFGTILGISTLLQKRVCGMPWVKFLKICYLSFLFCCVSPPYPVDTLFYIYTCKNLSLLVYAHICIFIHDCSKTILTVASVKMLHIHELW